MKSLIFRFILVLPVIFLTSCYTILYTPPTPNVPYFTEENSVRAEAGYGNAGIETKLAVSPVNHLAVMANGSFLTYGSRKQYFREIGIGTYAVLNKNFVGEFYLGYGFGTSSDTASLTGNLSTFSRSSYGEFERLFLQWNIGYVSENFEGGMSLRFCNVNFFHIKDDYIPVTSSRAWFFEPSINGKIGSKNIKMVLNMTFPILVGELPLFGFSNSVLSAGLQVNFNYK